MTVYNGEQTLAEVIESITSQTFTDFELIIFDDGSLDASAKVVQRCAEQDSRIRFFPLERNVGRGDAFNVGFFAAQGAYITSMDCDDICLPQRLKNQVEFMDAHSEVGALGTGFRAVYVDQDRMPYDRFMPSSHALILLSMHYRLALCAASVMYRLELLRSVGGITPGTRELQDFDLQFKMIWEARTVFANLPEILYIYRIDDESLSEIDARNGSPRRIAMWRAMLERLQVDDRGKRPGFNEFAQPRGNDEPSGARSGKTGSVSHFGEAHRAPAGRPKRSNAAPR